jgi:copper transport protein
MRRLAACVALTAAALLFGAQPSSAHAILTSSSPPAGAELSASPPAVVLTLSEKPDPGLSQIHVLDRSQRKLERTAPRAVAGKPRALQVIVGVLPRGVYTVTWRVLSAVDGHITGGAFAFGVGESPAGVALPKQGPATPSPSALTIAARWLYYAGLMLLLGGAWMGALAFARAARGPRAVAWTGCALAFAGVVALTFAQRSATGASLGALLSSSTGHGLLLRAAPLALAVTGLLVWRGFGAPLAALAAAASMLAHVAYGHAATGALSAGKVALQFVHFASAGVWIGGLAALLAGIRGIDGETRARAVRRFSAVATVALFLVVATGVARALYEAGSLGTLTSTTYGRMLLVKASLLAVIAVFGALNRRRNVPRAAETVRSLTVFSRTELTLAATVLVATAVLSSVAPGRSVLAARNARVAGVAVTGTDFGTTVRVRLEATPGAPGPNLFTLRATDFDTGKLIDAPDVPLTFVFRGRAGVQPSTLVLKRAPDGTYTGTGANLAFLGPWRITALMKRGLDSVEVPLALATRVEQQTQVIPGTPAIYSVALEGGRAVQFYVERPPSGITEVHATFLAPGGTEYRGLRDAVIVGSRADGTIANLSVRELSPGHYVGDGKPAPGAWRFDASVVAPDGSTLAAYFQQTL